jgi:hypothetical protein
LIRSHDFFLQLTVTEPYLRVFRSVIPPIGGFDISSLPAIFCLDILGKTAAAVGAEFPDHMKELRKNKIVGKPIALRIQKNDRFSMKGFKMSE